MSKKKIIAIGALSSFAIVILSVSAYAYFTIAPILENVERLENVQTEEEMHSVLEEINTQLGALTASPCLDLYNKIQGMEDTYENVDKKEQLLRDSYDLNCFDTTDQWYPPDIAKREAKEEIKRQLAPIHKEAELLAAELANTPECIEFKRLYDSAIHRQSQGMSPPGDKSMKEIVDDYNLNCTAKWLFYELDSYKEWKLQSEKLDDEMCTELITKRDETKNAIDEYTRIITPLEEEYGSKKRDCENRFGKQICLLNESLIEELIQNRDGRTPAWAEFWSNNEIEIRELAESLIAEKKELDRLDAEIKLYAPELQRIEGSGETYGTHHVNINSELDKINEQILVGQCNIDELP